MFRAGVQIISTLPQDVGRPRRPSRTTYAIACKHAGPRQHGAGWRSATRSRTVGVTGTFVTAWNDLTGGSDLLLAVGEAADNALFYNPCGWTNPAGTGAGSTPFSYLGLPLQRPPAAHNYEPTDGSTAAMTAALTAQLSHYALAGTLPNQAVTPPPISLPTKTCLGSPVVPVP